MPQQYTDRELADFMRHKFSELSGSTYTDKDLADFARNKYSEFRTSADAAPTPEDTPASVISHFGQGIGDYIPSPGQLMDTVKSAFYHPEHPLDSPLMGPAQTALQGQLNTSMAHIKAGQDALQQGGVMGVMDATAHGLGAFPVVGDPVYQMVHRAFNGEPARAGGNLSMLVWPELLRGGMGLTSKALTGTGETLGWRPNALGVPETFGERTPGWKGVVARGVERISENSLGGGDIWKQFRTMQAERLQTAANSIVEDLSTGATSRTGAEVGGMVDAHMNAQFAAAVEPLRHVYKDITGVDMIGTTPSQMLEEVRTALKQLKTAPGGTTVETTSGKRLVTKTEDGTETSSLTNKENAKGKTTISRTSNTQADEEGNRLTTFSGSTTRDPAANPQSSKIAALTQLQDELKEETRAFNKDVVGKALNKNPDTVYKLLTSVNGTISEGDIAEIRRNVGEENFNAMRGRALADLIQKNDLPKALADPQVSQRWKTILGDSEYAKLKSISDYSAKLNMPIGTAVKFLEPVISGILMAGTAAVGGRILEVAGVGAIDELAMNGVARIMTRPEGMTLMSGLVKALGTNEVKDIAYYMSRISSLAARESTRLDAAHKKTNAGNATISDKIVPPPLPQLQFSPREVQPFIPFGQTPPWKVLQ